MPSIVAVGNTGCIGLSVCGMAGFDLTKKQTKYPLTQKTD